MMSFRAGYNGPMNDDTPGNKGPMNVRSERD